MAENTEAGEKGWLSWLVSVLGWLVCAAFCLWLTIGLEPYPTAYEMFLPVALFILFANIFVFIFVTGRWGENARKLFNSVIRVCVGEGLILAFFYIVGKYLMAA